MKKGFTLIELLAVIVILAVIALIATPMILGVIETARESAAEASATGYIDAVEKQVMINMLDSNATQIVDGVYDLPMNGISVKGDVPEEGWIVIEKGEITNYSMKIMDYIVTKGEEPTKEGTVATKPEGPTTPEVSYVCKRATSLHSDDTYTYGNETVTDNVLTSGDAFDCDVDGSGTYDDDERFYYVTDLDTNSNYAVLIYYNNFATSSYASNNNNYRGPITAKESLPTTDDWKNDKIQSFLASTSRNITNELSTTTNDGFEIINPFNYNGYAARLLTYQELSDACKETITEENALVKCNYLIENNGSGYWLETPSSDDIYNAWCVGGASLKVGITAVPNYSLGVRPVIEVPKSDIDY